MRLVMNKYQRTKKCITKITPHLVLFGDLNVYCMIFSIEVFCCLNHSTAIYVWTLAWWIIIQWAQENPAKGLI